MLTWCCQLQLAGQERRRAQLVTTLTLLLVAFVMVTAVISGLATRHSSVETPLDANVTGQDHVGLHQGQTDELAEEGLVDLSKEWSDQAEQGVGEVAESVEIEDVVEGVEADGEVVGRRAGNCCLVGQVWAPGHHSHHINILLPPQPPQPGHALHHNNTQRAELFIF